MGCGHGWHHCGPWYAPPEPTGWCGPADWYNEGPAPVRRRIRRRARLEPEEAVQGLEARLVDLRDEIDRAEARLAELRREAQEAPGES